MRTPTPTDNACVHTGVSRIFNIGEGAHRSALLHVLTKKKGVKISDLEEVAYPLLGMESAKHKGGKGKGAKSGGDHERPIKTKAAAADEDEERPKKKKKKAKKEEA